MDYAIGVDIGSRSAPIAIAIVQATYTVHRDHQRSGEQERFTQSDLYRRFGTDVRLSQVADMLNPVFLLRHLDSYPRDRDLSDIIEIIVQLHATDPIRENVETAFAVNAVGQSFVNQFRHRCRMRNVFSRPFAVHVAGGTGYADGDPDNPARLGVDELLTEVALLAKSGHLFTTLTGNKFVSALHDAMADVNADDIRAHYDPNLAATRPRQGAGLLYALALAVWRYRHVRPGLVR